MRRAVAPSVLDLEVRRLEKEARERLRDLRSLLGRHPDRAREVLEALLTGPLVFTPSETAEGKRYRIEAEASLDRAVGAGIAGCSMTGVPSGIRTRVPGMKTLCPGPD